VETVESSGTGSGLLTQVSVRITEDLSSSSVPESGPMWAELWLRRADGLGILLDKGFVRAGSVRGMHSMIGFIGEVLFYLGDVLEVHAANFSGAAVTWQADATVEPDIDRKGTFNFQRLSTEHWAMFAYRNIFKQTNGAAGAIVVDFTPGSGDIMIVHESLASNSGTNTVEIRRIDKDNNDVVRYCDVASGSGTVGATPRDGVAPTSGNVLVTSKEILFYGKDKYSMFQGGAGAQNDTFTVVFRALIQGRPPTRSVARSTNPGDVDGIGVTDGTEGTPTINRVL
jgi:hypothetical protein